MKVLFLTQYDRNGPSSRIRVYQFVPFLEGRGVHCTVKPLLTGAVNLMIDQLLTSRNLLLVLKLLFKIANRYCRRIGDVLSARSYDVVVVQKDVLPLGLFFVLWAVNPRIIYEFDDAIWEPTSGALQRNLVRTLVFSVRTFFFHSALRTARAILAENSYLARHVVPYNSNVTVLCAPIDTRCYTPTPKTAGGPIVLGWIGSPATTSLLESLLPAIEEVGRCCPNTELWNIGGNPVALNNIRVNNLTWSEEHEREHLAFFDIGLMPLDDSPFNRGRLGYKMIIYFSLGLPTVAQNTGLNREVIVDGKTGFLAGSKSEWVQKLVVLIGDAGLRKSMGEKARSAAVTTYDIQTLCNVYFNLLTEVSKTGSQ